MSTTITTLFSSSSTSNTDPACGKCGADLAIAQSASLADAHARIKELEAQISILTLRATSAVERATEYETQVKRLQVTHNAPPAIISESEESQQPNVQSQDQQQPSTPPQTTTSRLARLLSTRYNTASAAPASPSPKPELRPSSSAGPTTDAALRDQLTHEQTLRRAAETAAARTNSEIEELTAQLFEQANEMVATERKARAKLESRVEMLEKRDSDKARRLGLLEMRVQRVERVRSLLEKPGS